jgi:hypothetical protein
MPQIEEETLRALLEPRFFGDGPPRWKMGHGRSWERWCDTAEEADVRRNAVITKLGRHFIPGKWLPLAGLRVRLRHCHPEAPCFSGACPVCVRALQRWSVTTGYEVGRTMAGTPGGRPRILSVVPDFGRVQRGGLRKFDFRGFRRKSEFAFRRAGIGFFRGALDVSFNHEKGEREVGYFQFQWWGLVSEVPDRCRASLRAEMNSSGVVTRPEYQFKPSWPRSALAYGVKDSFNRRESIWDESMCRRGRAPCRDTRNRDLLGAEWDEANLFLNRIGLSGRLLIMGDNQFEGL